MDSQKVKKNPSPLVEDPAVFVAGMGEGWGEGEEIGTIFRYI